MTPERALGEDVLILRADDIGRIIEAIEKSGEKRGIRLRTTMDYPFGEVWEIDRVMRECRRRRHERPRNTLGCWRCWRKAIRGTGDSLLLLVSRVRKVPKKKHRRTEAR